MLQLRPGTAKWKLKKKKSLNSLLDTDKTVKKIQQKNKKKKNVSPFMDEPTTTISQLICKVEIPDLIADLTATPLLKAKHQEKVSNSCSCNTT